MSLDHVLILALSYQYHLTQKFAKNFLSEEQNGQICISILYLPIISRENQRSA